jgi:CBS domain-containing protein
MTEYQSVRDIMMPDFLKIEGITKVSEALALMNQKRLNVILVEPRSELDVYGIMTRRDIARKVIGHQRKLHETHVYEIMTKPVLSVPPNMPLPYAARHLTNFNVSYATVLENNSVIGMISLNGIVLHWNQG